MIKNERKKGGVKLCGVKKKGKKGGVKEEP